MSKKTAESDQCSPQCLGSLSSDMGQDWVEDNRESSQKAAEHLSE